jgi:hypothetical protein
MSDQPPRVDTEGRTDRPERGPTGMPLWVKVFLVIAVLVVLAFLVTSLLGAQHGPGLHDPGGPSGETSSAITQP